MATLRGTCYCGNVCFDVLLGDPAVPIPGLRALFCHCESCRRAHSSPLYQVVYLPRELVVVVAGMELVRDFSRPASNVNRQFCDTCGTRLFNKLSHRPHLVGFFPALLADEIQHDLPEILKPTEHHLSAEAVLNLSSLCDDLPRV